MDAVRNTGLNKQTRPSLPNKSRVWIEWLATWRTISKRVECDGKTTGDIIRRFRIVGVCLHVRVPWEHVRRQHRLLLSL